MGLRYLDDSPPAAGRIRYLDEPQAAEPEPSMMDNVAQGVGNFAAGAVRGAGSIGATLLAPYDMARDAIDGKGLSLESNRQRRADMDYGLREMGADTDSLGYGAGKLVSEIAGTAGVGGVLGKGAQAVGAAPKVINALQSGGFSLGSPVAQTLRARATDAALRVGGGAVAGGAAAGLVDPDQAAMGAAIGGAAPYAIKGAKALGSGIKNAMGTGIKSVLGTTSGVGGEAISGAYRAGKAGKREFLDNMTGASEMTDVLASAKQGLDAIRTQRGNMYRQGMAQISGDKTVLDIAPVLKEAQAIQAMGSYKGQVINSKSAGAVQELNEKINEWASLDPAEFHTPEGLDALKKAIGDIRDSYEFGSPARKAADNVYHSIKGQITAQAPVYAKVMKDYETASSTLGEIEKALSLGKKSSADTAMRKLQSLMRNNVNTNYGNRVNLARELETQGGQEIMPALAGQAMNSWTPRGLAGGTTSLATLAAFAANPLAAPFVAAAGSPRMIGNMAYGAGRLTGGAGELATRAGQGMLGNRLSALLQPSMLSLGSTVPAVAFSRQ